MENLIETFHIDWRIFITQVINFTVVFLVLYWFAFKPLVKIMAERSGKIAKSLAEAKLIEEKLSQTKAEFNKIVAEAKKEANAILEKAAVQADAKKQETVVRAKEEIGQIINQEKQKMQTEKAATLKEIKKEVAGLVISAVEKVLGEKIDEKKDREIIKKMIK
ncbi:ATP synthase F0 subunit B [Candidatus Falkowbacteria bacterium RIFCSPHIGHO2_02_FULL_42_9]|uniref:ATP synthase subunit b n=1 Tax=Candidatus Falkowbacteria bacterium RIFCSPHIGHO2_02_FULL_42_9 TaxID=1797986 RepID=A0A1F5S9R1_9BACT|nr:MAG: ATP synthase F0 subunit B [Candidatus Falkowbacteria bacterium RIFCSPHIGHO2_02_FULL_42_9]